jgi:hypothetical protein
LKEKLLPYASADFNDECDNKYEGNLKIFRPGDLYGRKYEGILD